MSASMNSRTIVRRARAVARLYLDAVIDADIAYRAAPVDHHGRELHVLSRYTDALTAITCEIGCWLAFASGKTIGEKIAESGAGLAIDGRAEWRIIVGADVDARIADPQGIRKRPLPVPPPHAEAAIEAVAP